MVILIAAASFSWLLNKDNAQIEELELKVINYGDLSIHGANVPGAEPGGVLTVIVDSELTPVAGNGTDFFSPVIEEVTETDGYLELKKKQVTRYEAIAAENLGDSAMVVDFILSTTIEDLHDFILSPRSSITADLLGSPTINGTSAGHIAGAVRIAILKKEAGGTYTLKCIWIPNDKCELEEDPYLHYTVDFDTDPDPIVENEDYKVIYTGTPEEKYSFRNGTDEDEVSEITHSDAGYFESSGVLYIWDLQRAEDDGKYFDTGIQANVEYEYRMILWVDGSDRECHNAFLGGKMKLDLVIEQGGEADE